MKFTVDGEAFKYGEDDFITPWEADGDPTEKALDDIKKLFDDFSRNGKKIMRGLGKTMADETRLALSEHDELTIRNLEAELLFYTPKGGLHVDITLSNYSMLDNFAVHVSVETLLDEMLEGSGGTNRFEDIPAAECAAAEVQLRRLSDKLLKLAEMAAKSAALGDD